MTTGTTQAQREPKPRKKAFARRSTAGCLVCRQRRIKCDETKLRCKRCAVSGWTCEYPANSASRSSSTAKSSPADATPVSVVQLYGEGAMLPSERRAVHYFTQYVAPELFGFMVSDLWTYSVPQRCYSAPVVRSAIRALSSIHADFTSTSLPTDLMTLPPPDRPSDKFKDQSLSLYSAAVTDLRNYISNAPSRAEVLLSCAILTCCDLLRGEAVQASQHVDNGAAIIRAWQSEPCEGPTIRESDDMDAIVDAFRAFDLQATTFDDGRTPMLAQSVDEMKIPVDFSSLKQAQRHLVQLQSAAFADLIECVPYKDHLVSTVPSHLILQRRASRASFRRWWTAFERFRTQRSKLGDRREQAIMNVMAVQHHAVELLLDETLPDGNAGYSFDDAGDRMLQCAERALADSQALNLQGSSQATFSADLGLGCCLFLLVVKTTNADIRFRGIALLARIKRQEGWHRPEAMASTIRELTSLQDSEALLSSADVLAPHLQEMALEWVAEEVGLTSDVKSTTWFGSKTSWLDVAGIGGAAATYAAKQ